MEIMPLDESRRLDKSWDEYNKKIQDSYDEYQEKRQESESVNIKNNILSTRDEFFADIVYKCYKEMYANAQPPVDYDVLLKLAKEGKEDKKHPFYSQHYLSHEEYQYIIEKYLDTYNLKCPWHDHIDCLFRWLDDPVIDKYIERNGDEPGYRGYEHLKPLKEILDEESYNKVIDYINKCKDFYQFNRDETAFHWAMMNCSPCSNKKTVMDYWKEQGIDIEIEDRDPKYFYDRYYYGLTEKEAKDEDY